MDQAKELEVKKFMAGKIAAGMSLSEVQQQVNEAFSLKLTYMDIRILASELDNVDWDANDPKAQEKAKAEAKKAEEAAKAEAEGEGVEPPATGGKTVVEVSKLVRPGTVLSGSVQFASGPSADWYVDQTGRLGLENVRGGEPDETDIQEFQKELQKLFGR